VEVCETASAGRLRSARVGGAARQKPTTATPRVTAADFLIVGPRQGAYTLSAVYGRRPGFRQGFQPLRRYPLRSRAALIVLIVCALAAEAAGPAAQAPLLARHNRIIDLLSQNKVVLGWFAPARTADAAKKAAADSRMDFVFVNMEQVASYSPAEVKGFLDAMAEAGVTKNPNDRPLMTRLPIFHDDPAAARARTAEVLNLGVHAVVFPDMESREEAEQAIAAMRYAPAGVRPDETGDAPARWGLAPHEYRKKADVYPINRAGELASVFIIESEKGIANSREITRVRPTIAFPGPGTLRRVYQGDMAKVEQAIQTQLASCKEFDVPCGITANAKDVEKRIREGFRVVIIYDRDYAETIAVARAAAGR
jgi:2-keto-3-deoxy-L-rhamnonate aldolase RhmA